MFSWILLISPKTSETSNIFWSDRQVLAFSIEIHEFSGIHQNDWSSSVSLSFTCVLIISRSLPSFPKFYETRRLCVSFLFATRCFSKSPYFSEHLLTIPTCSGFAENFGNWLRLVLIFQSFSESAYFVQILIKISTFF